MKALLVLFFLPMVVLSQPTGNDAIYLNIFDIINKDTIFIGKNWMPSALRNDTKIKDGNYMIVDKGKDAYGFDKNTGDDYLSKIIFSKKNYTIEIIRKEKDTMRIHFKNFESRSYFLKVPFQKGDFIFSTPDEKKNNILGFLFPFHHIDYKSYGFDITPKNWDWFKVKKGTSFNTTDYAIYKFSNPILPYQATYQGYIYATKEKDTFKTYLTINEGKVQMHLHSTNREKAVVYYGTITDIGDSTFVFNFEYGYQLAVSKKMNNVPNAFINTDTSSGALIKGLTIISTNGKIIQLDTLSTFIQTEKDNFSIELPQLNAKEQKSVAIKLNYKDIGNATQLVSKNNPSDFFVFFLFDVEKHPWVHNQVLKVKLDYTSLKNLETPNSWLNWMGKFTLSTGPIQ